LRTRRLKTAIVSSGPTELAERAQRGLGIDAKIRFRRGGLACLIDMI